MYLRAVYMLTVCVTLLPGYVDMCEDVYLIHVFICMYLRMCVCDTHGMFVIHL